MREGECDAQRKTTQRQALAEAFYVVPLSFSALSTLRFRLTFISYANPAGRKTFVTGFNVQPSSFVGLLLCQSLRGERFPLCLAKLL